MLGNFCATMRNSSIDNSPFPSRSAVFMMVAAFRCTASSDCMWFALRMATSSFISSRPDESSSKMRNTKSQRVSLSISTKLSMPNVMALKSMAPVPRASNSEKSLWYSPVGSTWFRRQNVGKSIPDFLSLKGIIWAWSTAYFISAPPTLLSSTKEASILRFSSRLATSCARTFASSAFRFSETPGLATPPALWNSGLPGSGSVMSS
mmetsp:Transcript_29055/g.59430  ORF Transcript_29055/g.59430 Transcript_29055/m.59430 type:complete len:206 (+) Transcript_29055:320-937(+)